MPAYRRVSFVRPDDRRHLEFCRERASEKRSNWRHYDTYGTPIGSMVEDAARHVLGRKVPLDERRVLFWQECPDRGIYYCDHYREIDAVSLLPGGAAIYEVKLTTPIRMMQARGIKQLNMVAQVLTSSPLKAVRKRLVYIGNPVPVLNGEIPAVSAEDRDSPAGVIWIPQNVIERSAEMLGLDLPYGWFDGQIRSENWLETEDPLAEYQNGNAFSIPLGEMCGAALLRRYGEA